MERFLRYLSGYVTISIEGEQTERFLNLCRGRGIVIRNLCRNGEDRLTGTLSVRDFFRLFLIHRKTKVHIHILKKQGLPFFFFRNKKRKAFFIGILAACLLMALLSGRIWNIHIEGNVINSTPEILEFLGQQGITHGMAKSQINCSEIAALVRQQYPQITWVSARMEGTRLILTIQEGQGEENLIEEQEPCNLVSEVDGKIVKMITRSGNPQMKIGDTCKAGDLLVLGRIDITNDDQEVVRYEYVHADADIYIERQLSYHYEFPLDYEAKEATGNVKKGYYIKVGNFFLELAGSLDDAKESFFWRTITEEFPLRITENYKLPVAFGKITSRQYETISAAYTKEEAETIATKRLYLYEEKLLAQGIEITENNVTINISQTTCTSSGSLTIIQKTGREVDVETKEQQQTEQEAEY